MLGIVLQYETVPLPGYTVDLRYVQKYFPNMKICLDEESVREEIDKKEQLSFLYYSGHGVSDGAKMPSGSIINWNHLLNRTFHSQNGTAVLDCCDVNFDLPFKWSGERFRLQSESKAFLPGLVFVLYPKVAKSDIDGSIFSKTLLPYLSSSRGFDVRKLDNSSNFEIYSSRMGISRFII